MLLLLVETISATVCSQQDSLRSLWSNEAVEQSVRFGALDQFYELYSKTDMDATLGSLEEHYQISKRLKDDKQLFSSAKRLGNVYRLKGNYESAMHWYEKAEILARQLNDTQLQAAILGNMGNVHYYQSDYISAIQHFSSALKIYQHLGIPEHEGRMFTKLGTMFLVINNFELANEYFEKSLAVLNKQGIEGKSKAILYVNIGWTLYMQGRYAEAKTQYEKSLPILTDLNEQYFIAACHSNISTACLAMGNYPEARSNASKALELYQELGIKSGIIETKITLAKVAYQNDPSVTCQEAERILDDVTPETDKKSKRDLYELLYKCYKAQNLLSRSLDMHEQYIIYHDSIQLERNSFAVIREAVKNDFELKLYASQLENEREKTALKITQLKRTFGIIIGALLIIGLLSFYFLTKIRQSEIERDALIKEIETTKNRGSNDYVVDSNTFRLEREKIETYLDRALNETDWNVLNILLNDPVITNKEIATQAHMSVDGIGSSLRRMYEYFEVKESKYKKISLLLEAVKISNRTIPRT